MNHSGPAHLVYDSGWPLVGRDVRLGSRALIL